MNDNLHLQIYLLIQNRTDKAYLMTGIKSLFLYYQTTSGFAVTNNEKACSEINIFSKHFSTGADFKVKKEL